MGSQLEDSTRSLEARTWQGSWGRSQAA